MSAITIPKAIHICPDCQELLSGPQARCRLCQRFHEWAEARRRAERRLDAGGSTQSDLQLRYQEELAHAERANRLYATLPREEAGRPATRVESAWAATVVILLTAVWALSAAVVYQREGLVSGACFGAVAAVILFIRFRRRVRR